MSPTPQEEEPPSAALQSILATQAKDLAPTPEEKAAKQSRLEAMRAARAAKAAKRAAALAASKKDPSASLRRENARTPRDIGSKNRGLNYVLSLSNLRRPANREEAMKRRAWECRREVGVVEPGTGVSSGDGDREREERERVEEERGERERVERERKARKEREAREEVKRLWSCGM